MDRRMTVARILVALGLLAGSMSVVETLSFSWNPLFEAPALPEGATHTNYHAFREATLTIGTCVAILYALVQPAPRRTRAVWNIMAIVTVGYYVGWWLPWPLLGLHTPNAVAEADHIAAAALVVGAVITARSSYLPASEADR